MELINILWIAVGVSSTFFMASLLGCAWFWWKYYKAFNQNFIILIDKANRYKIHPFSYSGKKSIEFDKKSYFLVDDCALLNSNGKMLFIYSENKPNPMSIKYSKAEWLDSTSIRGAINNEYIARMVKPTDPVKDVLMYINLAAGIVSAAGVVIIALKLFEVF